MHLTSDFGWLVIIGLVAQLVDGWLGMGFGLTASAFLAALGLPPAVTSATVHAAQVATTGASTLSHGWFRNLDRKVFWPLLLAAVVCGVIGASVLARVPPEAIRPFVWAYLLLTSSLVLGRVLLNRPSLAMGKRGPLVGGIAGFLDAVGGGGWGTLMASTLFARAESSSAIAAARCVEFFVTIAVTVTLWVYLGALRYDLVIALWIGAAAGAPLAAWITRQGPQRAVAMAVGLAVVALGVTGLVASLT